MVGVLLLWTFWSLANGLFISLGREKVVLWVSLKRDPEVQWVISCEVFWVLVIPRLCFCLDKNASIATAGQLWGHLINFIWQLSQCSQTYKHRKHITKRKYRIQIHKTNSIGTAWQLLGHLINLIQLLSLCSETNKRRKRQLKNTNTSSTSSGYCHYAQKHTNTERDNSKTQIQDTGYKNTQKNSIATAGQLWGHLFNVSMLTRKQKTFKPKNMKKSVLRSLWWCKLISQESS